jgi:hypothetical protein
VFEQQLNTYKQRSDADPATVKLLQVQLDTFNSASKNQESKTTAFDANKAKQIDLAKESTPGGQATLAKSTAQAELATQQASQLKAEAADIAKPDTTGFVTNLDNKEYLKRVDSFTKSKEFTTLQSILGSRQQFNDILNDMANGKYTGADSVAGLFDAIGISVSPMQGKGMRINKDVINEHIDARGLDQTVVAKLGKLTAGTILSPQQLKDYAGIADGAYVHGYVNAVNDAHAQGIKADAILPKGNGQQIDPATAKVFFTLSNGNPAKARSMADSNGWKF